jgi:cytochrome c-type biogenesis protein CcmH/NrfG
LGYTLLYSLPYSGHEQDAIRVFQRNAQDFPQSSNVYDSLGEAYMKVGEKDLAITNYEKSLQLDPKNQNAVAQLKNLKELK